MRLGVARRRAAAAAALAAVAASLSLVLLAAKTAFDGAVDFRATAPAGFTRSSRHRVVLQHGYADCGSAAIATYDLLRGRTDSLRELSDELGTSELGTAINDMQRVLASRLGRPVIIVQTRLSSLSRDDLPIIMWHAGHFTVVTSKDDTIEILDPWFGDLITNDAKVRQWNVLVLRPQG